MTFHISEIALSLTFWAWSLLSFNQHPFHPLSSNSFYSGHRSCVLSFASMSASALPILLLLCPHSLQLWQLMMQGDWRNPTSKPCSLLLRQAISFHHLTKRGWKQNQAKKQRPCWVEVSDLVIFWTQNSDTTLFLGSTHRQNFSVSVTWEHFPACESVICVNYSNDS